MFNIFKKSRSKDEIFERDEAKNNTKRGNQRTFDYRRYFVVNFVNFIITFAVMFFFVLFIYSFFVKAGKLVYLALIKNTRLEATTTVIDQTYMKTVIEILFSFGIHMMLILVITLLLSLIIFRKFYRRLKGKRIKEDHTDLNTYVGDKKKLTVEEMFQQYAIFPDAGAKSKSIEPTTIVGHAFLSNTRKMKDIKMVKRDEHGNPLDENGDPLEDNQGELIYEDVKLFDENLQKECYESVGIKNKRNQEVYDPFKMKYRKIKNENKFLRRFIKEKWQTVGDFIKEDWYMPEDEMQRPAGVYFVETGPVNTVAIGTTRSAKGQTFVNNAVDMFSRESELQNMYINDPKGELLGKFNRLLEARGFETVVLNLIDPSRTHQFNVLAPAIAQARMGKFDKMGSLLTTIMNTFFPKQKEDPFWGNASQTLVKMIIYAMIDFYLEEERAYLQKYSGIKDEAVINRELDEMWGKVTMFNGYQMLTTMSRKEVLFCEKAIQNGEFLTKEEIDSVKNGVLKEDGSDERVPFVSKNGNVYMPDDAEQMTELSAFFKLIDMLPTNKMRIITLQQSDAMNELAPSERTKASIYGISLVSMLFFTEGPIMGVTCASPKQSLDPVSLAFPRRLRFKLNSDFLKEQGLKQRKAHFTAYRDSNFSDQIKTENPIDFEHTARIDDMGWVEFRFKGIFEEYEYVTEFDGTVTSIPKPIYIKMEVSDERTNINMHTYYFEFIRGYAKTVDGKRFVLNPHNRKRIEKDGTLRTGLFNDKKGFIKGEVPMASLANGMVIPEIEQTEAVYNIRPKAIFAITPPHLSEYIKVVIVMVAVLFDTSVAESYITNESGKPHYKTRNILDEIGNMHYDGHGIPDFQTKLSIGLGQGQEYLMVVQSLQQFRDVYGESVDKIVQSNTAVFMYLISNDTDMLEVLSKQAGTTHKARATTKSVNEKRTDVINKLDEMVQTQYGVEEEPLFPINELLNFTTGESMVLSARHDKDNSGEKVRPNPIHNTKGTMIPMAYALHKDGHYHEKYKRSLQNVEIATSSSNHDVYQDIPDFDQMYYKRAMQAAYTKTATDKYKETYGLTDTDLLKQDVDEINRNIMRIINAKISQQNDESINEDNIPEKDRTIRDELDSIENQFDLAENEFLGQNQKRFDKEVNKGQQAKMDMIEIENEKLFVNGTVSIEDIRQREKLKDVVGRALFDNRQRVNKIENDLYQFVANEGIKKIIEVQSGEAIATFNAVEDNQKQSWIVTDAFFEHILNNNEFRVDEVTVNLKLNVDRYFDIDGRKEVINLIQEILENEEEIYEQNKTVV